MQRKRKILFSGIFPFLSLPSARRAGILKGFRRKAIENIRPRRSGIPSPLVSLRPPHLRAFHRASKLYASTLKKPVKFDRKALKFYKKSLFFAKKCRF
jgi:hypothetical protein